MPPRKPKGPDFDFLASMLSEYGMSDTVDVSTVQEAAKEVEREEAKEVVARKNRMIEQELILNQLHEKHLTEFKTCLYCHRQFQTNYCFQNMCSDECRDAEYTARTGLRFSDIYGKVVPPPSFWQYEGIAIVSPETTERLYQFAKYYVTQVEEAKTLEDRRNSDRLLGGLELPSDDSSTESDDSSEPPVTTPGTFRTASSSEDDEVPKSDSSSLPLSDVPSDLGPDEFDVDQFLSSLPNIRTAHGE